MINTFLWLIKIKLKQFVVIVWILFLVCQCQKNGHCQNGYVCDGCNCILASKIILLSSISLILKTLLNQIAFYFNLITNVFFYSRVGQEPISILGCEHCPTGVPCDPVTGACAKGMCNYFYQKY